MNQDRYRICHVQILPILSGVQRAMLEMFRPLDPERYEIHVACQGSGPLTDELERLGMRWHAIPALDRPIHPIRDLAAYWQLRKLFEREKFSLVHTHSSKPGFLGRLAAHHANVKTIIHHVQGFAFHEFSSRHTRWMYQKLETFAAKRCHKIVFVNHEDRQDAIADRLLRHEQAITIYNGIDVQSLKPATHSEQETARQNLGMTSVNGAVTIAFCARLEPQKQPLILADIAAELSKLPVRRPWRLAIAGTGPLEADLKARCRELNVDQHIHFLGWQSSTHNLHAAADIALLPSLYEGLPVSLIESHAAGVPCVASNVKGNRETVTSDTGYLCAPKNAGEYARRLAELIDHADLRARLGQNARARAEEVFDTQINNQQLANLYEELLEADTHLIEERFQSCQAA